MQLKDVAVLITGGGSGLGVATARAMAAKGAKIAVLDQSRENAEKVAAEVKGVAVVADVTDEEQVKAAIAKAERLQPSACRDHVTRHFDVSVTAEGYEKVYRRVAGRDEAG